MTENIAETGIGLSKQCVKSSSHSMRTSKPNLLLNTVLTHEEHPEKTSTRMVIKKVVTPKVTRSPLPFSMTIIPVYSLGFSLKSIAVYIDGDSPYRITRSDRFPTSVFDIDESTEKEKRHRLFSNFSGTRYNLYQGNQLVMTIAFSSGFCRPYPFRQFKVYCMAPGIPYTSLFKQNDSQDLEVLFEYPDNKGKILKMMNQAPTQNLEGEYKLKFTRKYVMPAVENSVVVDQAGQVLMQMVKLGDNAFQIAWRSGVNRQWSVALALASLDFKWALQ